MCVGTYKVNMITAVTRLLFLRCLRKQSDTHHSQTSIFSLLCPYLTVQPWMCPVARQGNFLWKSERTRKGVLEGGKESQSGPWVVMADVRVGWRAGERVEINEKKGHGSAAEGRLSEEEESFEGRKGLIVEHRCFRWWCRCRQWRWCVITAHSLHWENHRLH